MFLRTFKKYKRSKSLAVSEADLKSLRESPFLDPVWYRETYEDLRDHPLDVALHYLQFGAAEGRDPGPQFDTRFYLENNPDVAASGFNPLVHYIRYGKSEGRVRKGYAFDPDFYATMYSEDLAASGLSAAEHFRQIGKARFYHKAFDSEWYEQEYADLQDYVGSLREHFISVGQYEGRHPSFHHDWYCHEYSDVVRQGVNPYEHYRLYGQKEGRHAGFDRHFYLAEYKDISAANLDPFLHYDNHGRKEGRYPAFNRLWYLLNYSDISRRGLDPYQHYRQTGHGEGRPLSLGTFLNITKWGHVNTRSSVNSPWELSEQAPAPSPDFFPKVSIIVPNYNHKSYLKERLETIFNQSYRNVEVILLDDFSNDGSIDVLRAYVNRYPEKTKLIANKQNSGGVFHQWKRGIENATGDLIWIAESDDYCSLNFLSELIYFFRNNGVMVAFSRTDFVAGDDRQVIWTSEAYWSEIGFSLGHEPVVKSAHEVVCSGWGARNLVANVSSMLFRNPGKLEILDDPEWQKLRMCGDWVFYLSLIRGGLIGYSPHATNYYRQHSSNTSVSTHDKDIYYKEHEVVAKYLTRLFNVDNRVLKHHEEVLYRHWVMKRGTERRCDFERLFSLDKVISERANRKPNIAIAIYALVTGGGEVFPILMANLLHARGFPVTILNFEMEVTNPGIRNVLSASIPLIELCNSADCGSALEKLGIELVHSHHSIADTTLALSLSDHPQIRHIVTTHGLYEILGTGYVEKYKEVLRNVDAFVYIADKNLDAFGDKFKDEKYFTKITNTIALAPLSGLNRTKFGIDDEDFVVCLASRAVAEKGWQEAIEAVILANECSNKLIRLLLIGDGPEAERLKHSKLPPFIHLMGFQKNVRDFFSISDIGLIASKFQGESCPLVLIECLSVGKPVIASDIGDIRNMLEAPEGLAGMVHVLDDWSVNVANLAELISEAANNTEIYTRLKKCVAGAAKKFDQNVVIDRYIELYNEILSGAPASGFATAELHLSQGHDPDIPHGRSSCLLPSRHRPLST